MKAPRALRVFLANVRANLWCLTHFGDCIYTQSELRVYPARRRIKAWTTRIAVGRGSVLPDAPRDIRWVDHKVFFAEGIP